MVEWYDDVADGTADINILYAARWNSLKDFSRLAYNEGIITAPTITYVDGTHVKVTTCDVLIRSDAVFGADNALYKLTVPESANLAITADVVNYIYVYYNAGSPIFGATTSRNTLNNSNYLPVARVIVTGGAIEYQLSYGVIGKGAAIKNFDRVLRIRGSAGIEKESGLVITETATRVVNISAGYVWFGLERIPDTTLTAIAQGGSGVVSQLWYHTGAGTWTKTTATQYNNTQYDLTVAPYGLTTLSNNSKYAVNWIFRNIVTKEIVIVLGTADYTLSQAEASFIPDLPAEITSFYLLVGRIIVQKSQNTAYAIENVTTVGFRSATTTVHSELSNLGYADAGHTGFTPNPQYQYIPILAKDFKVAAAEAGFWDTDALSNGIPEVRMTYTHSEAHNAYASVIMPQDWDGGNLTIFPIWKTASADGNTFILDVYAARFADNETRDVALTTKVATMTDTNNGAGKVNQGPETSAFTITGTGKTIELKLTRDYATDTLAADVLLLGVMIKCIVTKV
jgi:hypothetical protein